MWIVSCPCRFRIPESIKNRFPLGQTPNRHTRGTGEMSAFQRIEGMEAW